MYSLLLLLSVAFLTAQSLNVPFCINCKHFISDNIAPKFGKCKMSPIDVTEFLVSGNTKDIKFDYCTTARTRNDMCGKNGTKFNAI